MIRMLWARLTGKRQRSTEPPAYDPDSDPLVRKFRYQRRQSERHLRHIERRVANSDQIRDRLSVPPLREGRRDRH